jgi:lactate dehydrogenase-like 2-hydroxyacid dehydrogenase
MAAPVVSAVPLTPEQRARLGAWDVAIVDLAHADDDLLAATLPAAEGVLINSHVRADPTFLGHAPHLRVVSTVSVGFDHIDLAVTGARGIAVTTTPVLSDAVADLTMALMTMTLRKLTIATADMARGVWSNGLLGTDLKGKTLLLVGFGRIGREVAARALAAKMRVIAYDARIGIATHPEVELVPTLTAGLAEADVVSLHVDLNPSTYHLLDEDAIAHMKLGAFVVNTSRGGVVDQVALTAALVDGRLAGAGLDVLAEEPPDPADPLLALPNVVVLPHIASATVETRRAMLECGIDNLAACLRGEQCPHVLGRPV